MNSLKIDSSAPPLAVALSALLALLGSACGRAEGGEAGYPVLDRGLVVLPPGHPDPAPGAALEQALALAAEPEHRVEYHTFGEVETGVVVSHTWSLYNSDPVPVTVRKVQTPCTCSVPAVRWVSPGGVVTEGRVHDPEALITVPPGEVLELTIRIDTDKIAQKNTPKLEVINVITDSVNAPYRTLEANLMAVAEFQVTPRTVDLGRVPANGHGADRAIAITFPGRQGRLDGTAEAPVDLGVTVTHAPEFVEARWIIDVVLEPPHEVGRVERAFTVGTLAPDGAPGEPLEMRVVADIVPDVQALPGRLLVPADAPAEVEVVSHHPGQRLGVLRSAVEGDHADALQLTLEPDEPDGAGRSEAWTVRLERGPDAGALEGEGWVHLDLDDAQVPRLSVPYALLPPR